MMALVAGYLVGWARWTARAIVGTRTDYRRMVEWWDR